MAKGKHAERRGAADVRLRDDIGNEAPVAHPR